MITGARQVGKTTLARATYPNLNYISLDEIEERFRLRDIPTRAWGTTVGPAVVDEVQKEPSVFDKLKAAYDRREVDFTVLLGSSQILMLSRIRESLSGRVYVYELWPLLLCELTGAELGENLPLFDRLLTESSNSDNIFQSEPTTLLGGRAYIQEKWLNHVLAWGGMPGLLDLSDQDRREWLRSYTLTYLERDLSDLVRLDDLAPFRRFLRLAALRSGQLLSYADLARDTGVSPNTARSYLNYLSQSYQAFLLHPFYTNRAKRLVKSPKIYWIDVGLYREQAGIWGELSGPLLETFVVGQCYSWIKTMRPNVEMWFYRTHDGLEVDLLITTSAGIWGIEIKTSRKVDRSQTSSLRRLAKQMEGDWLGGIVVYMGQQLKQLDHNLWAVPVSRLFG
jgi:predicted AAA+ superfamily ATPase